MSLNRCGLASLDEFQPGMTDCVRHSCGFNSAPVPGRIEAICRDLSPPVWQTPVVGAWQEKRIIGFWHIGAVGDYSRIVAEQYRLLVDSGLYAASERIFVGFVGGRHHEANLPAAMWQDRKIEVFVTDDPEDFEYPTLSAVWHAAQVGTEPFLSYYFHTKGASLALTAQQAAANAWRRYMEYFNIEKWQDCVSILSEYETAGVELQDQQSHYSGNFWWATSDYIRKLPDADEYWEKNKTNRLAAEYYLCMATPRAYCFNDFFENLYDFILLPERYRK